MTVRIEDDLLQDAQEELGTRTKRETIVVALEEVRRRRRLKRVLEHAGTMELGFTLEDLRRMRDESLLAWQGLPEEEEE